MPAYRRVAAVAGALAIGTVLGSAPHAAAIVGDRYPEAAQGTVAILTDAASAEGRARCTGTLLNATKVLTASECATHDVDGSQDPKLTVRADSTSWTARGTTHKVERAEHSGTGLAVLTLATAAGDEAVELTIRQPLVGDDVDIRGYGGTSLQEGTFTVLPGEASESFRADAVSNWALPADLGAPVFNLVGQQVGVVSDVGTRLTELSAIAIGPDIRWIIHTAGLS